MGSLITQFISLTNQVTNIFTKALPRQSFLPLWSKLGLWPATNPSLRGHIEDPSKDERHAMLQACNPNQGIEYIGTAHAKSFTPRKEGLGQDPRKNVKVG